MASRTQSEEGRNDAETLVARFLLERIRHDKHPSITQMSLLEEMLPPSLRREYLNILLEKAMSTPTPSISLLRRMQQVAQQL